MTRVVVYVEGSRMAPKVSNGGLSIPRNPRQAPDQQPEELSSWLNANWRVHSCGGYHRDRENNEVTVLVLEHD
jgi:hypothetical protein